MIDSVIFSLLILVSAVLVGLMTGYVIYSLTVGRRRQSGMEGVWLDLDLGLYPSSRSDNFGCERCGHHHPTLRQAINTHKQIYRLILESIVIIQMDGNRPGAVKRWTRIAKDERLFISNLLMGVGIDPEREITEWTKRWDSP